MREEKQVPAPRAVLRQQGAYMVFDFSGGALGFSARVAGQEGHVLLMSAACMHMHPKTVLVTG